MKFLTKKLKYKGFTSNLPASFFYWNHSNVVINEQGNDVHMNSTEYKILMWAGDVLERSHCVALLMMGKGMGGEYISYHQWNDQEEATDMQTHTECVQITYNQINLLHHICWVYNPGMPNAYALETKYSGHKYHIYPKVEVTLKQMGYNRISPWGWIRHHHGNQSIP